MARQTNSFLSLLLITSMFGVGVVVIGACSDQSNDTPQNTSSSSGGDVDAAPTTDEDTGTSSGSSGSADTGADSGITGKCADTFGDKLTEGFGRIDGLVWAVQKPSDTQCVFPNNDHVIIQVLMNGAVYRIVANVQSDRDLDDGGKAPPVRFGTVAHALPAPAWAEGWHTVDEGVALDYPTTLGVHNDAPTFTPGTLDENVTRIVNEVKVGEPISIYGQSGAGRPESAHLIHRNGKQKDGAIVVSVATSPKFLMFHFGDQTF